jgi:uncharacterized lipoprotein YmbA
MRLRRTLLFLATLALTDCGTSPKTHYFTLSAAPGTDQKRFSISAPVTVAAVHVPLSLNRPELVRLTSANAVDISERDRWTAPLGDMMRGVLSQDLMSRLPQDKIVLPDVPAPPHTAQIVVSIIQFAPDASGIVTLDGSWSLLEGGDRPVLLRDVTLKSGTVARDAEGQAAAMSELVGELASRIAATLGKPRRSSPSPP